MNEEKIIKTLASTLDSLRYLLDFDEILLTMMGSVKVVDTKGLNPREVGYYCLGAIGNQPLTLLDEGLDIYAKAIEKKPQKKKWYACQKTNPEFKNPQRPDQPSLQYASRQWDDEGGTEPDVKPFYLNELDVLENLVEAGSNLFDGINSLLIGKGYEQFYDADDTPVRIQSVWVGAFGYPAKVVDNSKDLLGKSLEKSGKRGWMYFCEKYEPELRPEDNYSSVQLSPGWEILQDYRGGENAV